MFNHNMVWESSFHRGFYFARPLIERGHEVTLVTNSKKKKFGFKEYNYQGVQIIEAPDLLFGKLRTGWDLINAFRRSRYLKGRKFDIIHAIDTRPTVILPALKVKKNLNIPLVIDWLDWWGRGGAIELRKNKILNKLFSPIETYFEEHYRQYGDFTTTISTRLKKRAIDLGIKEETTKVIFHGCDTKSVLPMDKSEARKSLNISGFENVLLFSGFVLYDLGLLLNSFKIVLEKYPKTLLLLTGSDKILNSADFQQWKNHDNVRCLGFLPKEQYSSVLGATDICILPLSDNLANRARYPGKFGDYMASGRPVVSNDIGDVGTLIKDNKVGVLTDPNPAAFSDGIKSLLGNSKSMEEMGKNARKLAEEKMSFDILSKDFEDIFKSLVK